MLLKLIEDFEKYKNFLPFILPFSAQLWHKFNVNRNNRNIAFLKIP